MIRIGKYGIDTTDRSFVIGKIRKSVDKKTGIEEETLDTPGYYSTLENALKGLYRRYSADALKSFDGSLDEAIQAVRGYTRDFEELVKKALPLPKLPRDWQNN